MEHPTIRGLSGWKPLARGGSTLVWEARQDLLARLVAVKVYQGGLTGVGCDAFSREAAAAGRLSSHPGVVTTYGAGLLPDRRPYVVMELCPHGSLTSWLSREDQRSEEQIRSVGIRVADALAAVHAHGVIHRDVKPANVLIDVFGSPRLADFGLATVAGTAPAPAEALLITPSYAPPEAFQVPVATESGDVFSLAATLYALLAGSPPRRLPTGGDVQQLAEIAAEPITPLPGVNWFLMDVLMAALSINPDARPSAAELRDQLSSLPGPRTRLPRSRVLADHRSPARRELPVLVGRSAATPGLVAAESASSTVAARVSAKDDVGAPRRRRVRRVGMVAMVAAAVTLVVSSTAWLIAEPASSGAPTLSAPSAASIRPAPAADRSHDATADPSREAATPAPTVAVDDTDSIEPGVAAIRVSTPVESAEPFETVRIRGVYPGGEQTFVEIQRWADGSWQAFPVPAKTDSSGQFTAYVELGRPSNYRLRVRDPASGVKSEPFVLVITG